MGYSRKQQQVLGGFFLLYGMWVLFFVSTDMHKTLDVQDITDPDPIDLLFYIDTQIDVNLANAEELQLLPGVGPVLARRIIAYREEQGRFHSLDSLKNVRGIGPKTVQKIRHYLRFP